MAEQAEKKTEEKKSSSSSLVLILGIVFMALGIGIGVYFFMTGKEAKPAEGHKEAPKTEGGHGHGHGHASNADKIFYFDMPDMLINLVSNNKKGNFLKMSISVEFENSQILEKIKTFKPRMVDQFQVFLRSLRMEELRGSAGLERIREELLRRTNLIMAPDKVTNILFREVLVQ